MLPSRDQSADPQALDRPERIERHPLQPDRRPEADRIGAAQKYSRQSSKSRIPPLAMIGSRMPASRSSATTRRPIGLIAGPDRRRTGS